MKYIGSKAKIAKHIVPIIQDFIDKNNIEWYVEPFVGGANVIDKINCKHRYGFDIDDIAITLFKKTQENPDILEQLPEECSREHYYLIRNNTFSQKWYRSAILLFASYNARVYGGCYGACAKTKDGKVRNYYKEAINNYKKQIPNILNIKFQTTPYWEIDKFLELKNCVIYCDPPYAEGIGYKTNFNHEMFWSWVRIISKNNIVLVSEYTAPDDFDCIWSMPVKTHLNNRNKLDKLEKLFIYKGEKYETN